MTDTAGESSARGPEDTPAAPEEDSSLAPEVPAPPRPTGVRWSDDAHPTGAAPTGDTDATPPSGVTAPGPGDVVPARTSGTAPDPTPGAAWPNPAFQPGPWQQTAPGWAPAPPQASPPDPARRRRTRRIVLGVVLGVVVLALVVVALLAFLVGPRFARYDVLDRAAVERGVTDVVTRDWKRQVTGVTCPEGERVRPGTTFTCTGTVDGRPMRIPVDVVDESGTYEVGQPR
ncbi:DUF4333 domain-containing protein [Actinomycetospora sp. CA-084318]|uniref:DUF4333 domain-containing protein n=1 Tax=Actinomycetospora sp. CA-084318 TaxID=3239892 RepID=UPI003D96C0C9